MDTSLVSIVPSGGHLQVQWWPGLASLYRQHLYFITHYTCEKTNPPIKKKPVGCLPADP